MRVHFHGNWRVELDFSGDGGDFFGDGAEGFFDVCECCGVVHAFGFRPHLTYHAGDDFELLYLFTHADPGSLLREVGEWRSVQLAQRHVGCALEFAYDGGNRCWSSRWGWEQRLLSLWWGGLGKCRHVSLELLHQCKHGRQLLSEKLPN